MVRGRRLDGLKRLEDGVWELGVVVVVTQMRLLGFKVLGVVMEHLSGKGERALGMLLMTDNMGANGVWGVKML